MDQNSSTKFPDKVGDEDTQTAVMRTAAANKGEHAVNRKVEGAERD
jgi:hypothetical protein